jgi:hypothetical protein
MAEALRSDAKVIVLRMNPPRKADATVTVGP